ncbi:hypothetical protein MKW98_007784 [Papaver atlanticum]|uniref:RNA 3'-terminal phosphate cyclase domain-containing protein n=1 Tax=Papaver atlanticum TaxID=357466 RepID=A0AAD4RYN6_9MAGN|nr:hypothetical protein MKW98_007784 [Papaver atlanticum]
MKLKGSRHFRERLVLSTLSGTPISIEEIRADETWPGLRSHEIKLLRLIEEISDGGAVVLNETGTKLKYTPGVIICGKRYDAFDCGLSRSIGYFLEPLIVLGLFGKKSFEIKLNGITNDSKDPIVDTFRSTTLNILKRFGIDSEGVDLKIVNRGAPPLGGGEVILKVPMVESSLSAVTWIDEGMIIKMEIKLENLLDLVYHWSLRPHQGASSLLILQLAMQEGGNDEDDEREELMPPEEIGEQAASMLLGEIEQGGVVDSRHQGLLFLLCALCPQDVSKVRVGKLSPYAIETLRHIRDFLGVKFVITPDPSTETVILKCLGCGLKNLSRKFS